MSFPFSQPAVLIANGTALSAGVFIGAAELMGIQMPAAWTAAGITFQASVDGVTYQDMFDAAGSEIALTVAAAHFVALGEETAAKSEHFRGPQYIKVRSGTTGTAVNQGADRTLTLVLRKSLTGAF